MNPYSNSNHLKAFRKDLPESVKYYKIRVAKCLPLNLSLTTLVVVVFTLIAAESVVTQAEIMFMAII